MRSLAIAVVLISGTILFAAAPTANLAPLFQAFCNDGDGPLSGWLDSRYEAYLMGRDHELANRGHRWDILVQTGETVTRVPACARLADGSKPDRMALENTCGKCVRFTVSRTTADGTVKSREIKIDANKTRQFRKLPNATIKVEGERDCSEQGTTTPRRTRQLAVERDERASEICTSLKRTELASGFSRVLKRAELASITLATREALRACSFEHVWP